MKISHSPTHACISTLKYTHTHTTLYGILHIHTHDAHNMTTKSTIGEMIIPNDRYVMHETESNMYAVQMTLTIKHLHKPDFGGYKCISKNSIGGIEATIRLYGKLCIRILFGLLYFFDSIRFHEEREKKSCNSNGSTTEIGCDFNEIPNPIVAICWNN